MYHEPESFESLLKKWINSRSKELFNTISDGKKCKNLIKNPKMIQEFFAEIFEDCENLVEWREATK